MDKKYRIAWKAKLTGATGHGTGVFTLNEARRYADELNKDENNRALGIYHWVELVEDKASPKEA